MPGKDDPKNEEQLRELVEENLLQIRDCGHYRTEYKQCKSLSARFHQYFVDGEFRDCSEWKEDMKNCEIGDFKAYASIIKHENERWEKRRRAHLANDVWERRKEPPSNWEMELPSFITERQTQYFEESEKLNKSTCTIL